MINDIFIGIDFIFVRKKMGGVTFKILKSGYFKL